MSTRQATADNREDDGSTRSSATPWSDLPDDLLGNIRLRTASQSDRAHLAAVCKPWRKALTRIPWPAAAPLLLLSPCRLSSGQTYLCGGRPDDGLFLRIMDKLVDKRLVGAHDGGWVVAFDSGSRELMLVNLFSGAEMGVVCPSLPRNLWQTDIFHVVLSDGPTSSSGCILATIIDHMHDVALCKVGCRSGWTTKGFEGKMFGGIAFCNGDLYCLVYPGEELVKLEIYIKEEGGLPFIKSTHRLAILKRHGPTFADYPLVYECYILELHGKPLKAVSTQWLPNREPFFKIFELINADTNEVHQYKWAEVTSFGDYALFLGQARSKAVRVPMGAECRGFKRNHIYYSIATCSRESNLRGDELYALRLDDGHVMYCREGQCFGDDLERTGYFMTGFVNASMRVHTPNL